MSSQTIVDFAGNKKIYDDLLPNPYPYPAFPSPLAAVLLVSDDAGNQDIENLRQLNTSIIAQQDALLGSALSIGGLPNTPLIGGALRIQGATTKGSLLVGDGLNTAELICPTTNTANLQTETIYNWNTLSNGQSKVYTVPDGSVFQPGYSITITYSGTDFVTGTITAVVGNDITMTITNKANGLYINGPLITTTSPDGAVAGNPTNPVFDLNPATTTPTPPDLPNNSMITGGLAHLYSVFGDPNPTPFTISILGTNIQRPTSASANTPLWENPTITPVAYSFPDGCFVFDSQIVQIQANTSGAPVAFGFPAGGSFVNQDYCGTILGYTLPYGAGTIAINSKLVLTADPLQPLGVFWGVDAQGVGTVTSVSAGTNINVSGSLSAPVVNLATPTTSNIQLGVGTELVATNGPITMSVDATGFNDIYSSGGVVNQEDIAVSSTDVVQTLSATQSSDYVNSAVLSCNPSSVSDTRTSQVLTAGFEKTATTQITCSTSGAQPNSGVTCSASAPTTSPFPDVVAVAAMNCSDTTNPNFSLAQSAPFATSYTTTINKDGITQNNSAGAGFNLQTAQDLTLTCPTANKIIVPNGNDIDLSSTTGSIVHTTTYGKDGMSSADFNAGSFASTAELVQNNGNSQLFVSGSNLGAGTNNYVRVEANSGGNCAIEHQGTAGNNLNVTTTGRLNMLTGTDGFLLQGNPIAGGAIQGNSSGELIESGNNIQFTSTRVGGVSQPSFTFNNQNATATSYPAVKLDRTQGNFGAGDTLGTISNWGRDATGTSREWTRIQAKTENVTAGNQDATLSIFNAVNGTIVETFNFNGGQNENNSFRPLDMNGNNIRTTQGNLAIDATASVGTGSISLLPRDNGNITMTCGGAGGAGTISATSVNGNISLTTSGLGDIFIDSEDVARVRGKAGLTLETTAVTGVDVAINSTRSVNITANSINSAGNRLNINTGTNGGIALTGAALQSGTSSGNSGQHLVITLNGVQYKIALENP